MLTYRILICLPMSQLASQAVTPDGHDPTGWAEDQGVIPREAIRPWEPDPDPSAETRMQHMCRYRGKLPPLSCF